jgi:hypothetical protein
MMPLHQLSIPDSTLPANKPIQCNCVFCIHLSISFEVTTNGQH